MNGATPHIPYGNTVQIILKKRDLNTGQYVGWKCLYDNIQWDNGPMYYSGTITNTFHSTCGAGGVSYGDGEYFVEIKVYNGTSWTVYWTHPTSNVKIHFKPAPYGWVVNDIDYKEYQVQVLNCRPILSSVLYDCTNVQEDWTFCIKPVDCNNFDQDLGPQGCKRLNLGETFDLLKLNGAEGLDLRTIFTLNEGTCYKIWLKKTQSSAHNVFKVIKVNYNSESVILQDDIFDYGKEPNDVSQNVFLSRAIQNQTSATYSSNDYGNPDFVTIPGNTNKIYLNMYNIGCYHSDSITMRAFWTRARTDEIWPKHWLFDSVNNVVLDAGNIPRIAGSEITIEDSSIYSQDTRKVTMTGLAAATGDNSNNLKPGPVHWLPPNPDWYKNDLGSFDSTTKRPLICIMGMVRTPTDSLAYDPPATQNTPVEKFVRANNNVATRNYHLVNDANFAVTPVGGGKHHGWNTVTVNNGRGSGTLTSELTVSRAPRFNDLGEVITEHDDFTDYGKIYIGLDSGLWELWRNGGKLGSGFVEIEYGILQLSDPFNFRLSNIALPDNIEYTMGVKFLINPNHTLPVEEKVFVYQLLQDYGLELGTGSPSLMEIRVQQDSIPAVGKTALNTEETPAKEEMKMHVFPNPFGAGTAVMLVSDGEFTGSLNIYDMQGKKVKTLCTDCRITSGRNEFEANLNHLAPGTYIVKFVSKDKEISQKMIKH